MSSIGERRKPWPEVSSGYIHIDTVHQGDLDKLKGVYHINVVDEPNDFEVVCRVDKIFEFYVIPGLEEMLADSMAAVYLRLSDYTLIVLNASTMASVSYTRTVVPRADSTGRRNTLDYGSVYGSTGRVSTEVDEERGYALARSVVTSP